MLLWEALAGRHPLWQSSLLETARAIEGGARPLQSVRPDLPRPLLAAWNTFVLDEHARMAVPGMAVLYERLVNANAGAPVFYLSTGAWNVAPTPSDPELNRFIPDLSVTVCGTVPLFVHLT